MLQHSYIKLIIFPHFVFFTDFDGDDYITSNDLRELITRLTGDQQLTADEMQQLINDVSENKIISTDKLTMYILTKEPSL